ncbi:uncharacterized protein conserved in bacteria [alpha proteobacterium U9-1i]|nr:uncharacterized protein conserved in bacteria [alpha proteobacterium U9-1i]
MYDHGLIAPAVALVIWSLVILIWLYATRIPAMRAAGVKPNDPRGKAALDLLPTHARNVAANYNHLMEQPTLFYALCFALQFLEQTQPINIGLAWTYVVLRVVHSLVQCTFNFVPLRFLIFVVCTIVLIAMSFHAAIALGFVPDVLH